MDKRFVTRTRNLNDSANNDVGWEGNCGDVCNQCKQHQKGEEEGYLETGPDNAYLPPFNFFLLCLGVLQELNETCRMMQQRVGEFLSQVADDAVTLTLIQLNDELNSAFQR
ncbi:unnamed protein product [Taenia asiatica]|uniref:GAT domain-containing protein n=1 Tax=Taenia asiatica TaxID=60517 RepID=A0A0R3VYS0_TAEAS|nr:unnamed protein product [Taenia asiatica]